jgi:DNA-binding NtrC family response regulator
MRLGASDLESRRRDDEIVAYYSPTSREKICALLIDDDAADAAVVTRLCTRSKQLDFDVKLCFSVEDGQRLSKERRFDIVFVDYWLGLQTSIEFIAAFTRSHAAPVILMTGLDEPDIRRIAFRAGVSAFLSKEDLSTQAIEAVTLAVLYSRLAR